MRFACACANIFPLPPPPSLSPPPQSYLFFKMIDKDDELVRRDNDHTFVWYRYYPLGKILRDRDTLYLSTRKVDVDGTYIIAFKSITDESVPVLDSALRSFGYGGYMIRPKKGKRMCEVTRFHYFDFKGNFIPLIRRKLLDGSTNVLLNVQQEFNNRAEGKRIEEIRKARILQSSIEWRNTRDEYSEQEKSLLKSGKCVFRQILNEIDDLEDSSWLEIRDKRLECYRKTVTMGSKSFSNPISALSNSSSLEEEEVKQWERRISDALAKGRGSMKGGSTKNAKVMPIIINKDKDGSDSMDASDCRLDDSTGMSNSLGGVDLDKSNIKRLSSDKDIDRNSSRHSWQTIKTASTGLKAINKWQYHGFARTIIECDASLVMAWCCDDQFKMGVRQAYDRPNTLYVDLEEENDHQKIDYRQHNLEWPVKPRYVIMRHIKEEDEHGVYWIVSMCINNYDESKLPPSSSKCLQVEANSIVRITPMPDGKCELAYWAYSDPKGKIPTWVLKINVPNILDMVSKCKEQLDKNSLAAKRLTFSERMAKMRKRVAVKWNNEALIEKCCNCLGAMVAKFFVEISYRDLLLGFGCIFIQVSLDRKQARQFLTRTLLHNRLEPPPQESASDIMTVLMCKWKLRIDMVKFHLTMVKLGMIFLSVLCLISIAVSCTVAFCFVHFLINPTPLPSGHFT